MRSSSEFGCTCGETDSLRLQGEGEDFLFVWGWEGGGEIVISALSSGCRRLLPESSQMSMKSPIGLGSLFGLDDEGAWVFGSASWGTWWASLLVWACISTIVSRDFGLIGCSEDVHLVGVEVGEDLVGVVVGFGFEGF